MDTPKPNSAQTAKESNALDVGCVTPTAGGPDTDGAKKKRSTGNKIFDWAVYSSIAWAGVSAMSLLTAHEAVHGKNPHFEWLRTIDKKLSKSISGGLSKTFLKDRPPEVIERWGKDSAMYIMLGLGGTMLMAPIKWMEDNRLKLSCKIDNLLGTTPPSAEDIAAEPKQTWKSVLAGRVASVGVGLAAFALIGPPLASKISKAFGGKFTNAWMKFRPQSNQAVVRKWMDMGAFDVLFTTITASVTYAFSRRIAAKHDKKLDAEDELVAINPVAPTALEPGFPENTVDGYTKTLAKPWQKLAVPDLLYTKKLDVAEAGLGAPAR